MDIPERWRRGLLPDPTVLELLAHLQAAAQAGKIRALAVVTLNPMLEVETSHAGGIDAVRRRLLGAGCTEASLNLLKPE